MPSQPREAGSEVLLHCDLCGGTFRDHTKVGSWGLARCSSCGVVATTPRPTTDTIGNYYAVGYDPHTVAERRSRLWQFREDVRAAKSRCPRRSTLAWHAAAVALGPLSLLYIPWRREGERLAEVGSGSGQNVAWANRNGWQAVGVDPSLDAVATALRNGQPSVVGTAEALPLAPGSADVVLMNQALEHTHRPAAALSEAHRILAQDGLLVVSVPNFGSVGARTLRDGWHCLEMPRHLWHFDPASLEQAAIGAGFEPQSLRFTHPAISLAHIARQRIRLGPKWRPISGRVFRAPTPRWRVGDCMLLIARKP